MVSQQNILDTIQQLSGTGKTFAEFIAELFKDRFIEIYVGDSYEDISTEQITTSYPAVFCGKVIAAYKECLVICCAYIPKQSRHMQLGNFVFVNERAIRALNQVDGNGTIEEMMLRSAETVDIMKSFNK